MTKMEKKNVKTAILIYNDPDLKEGRRVIFGDIGELIDLFFSQFPLVQKRINEMSGKDFKTPDEMIKYYKVNKEEYIKLYDIKVGEKISLDLGYEVKGNK